MNAREQQMATCNRVGCIINTLLRHFRLGWRSLAKLQFQQWLLYHHPGTNLARCVVRILCRLELLFGELLSAFADLVCHLVVPALPLGLQDRALSRIKLHKHAHTRRHAAQQARTQHAQTQSPMNKNRRIRTAEGYREDQNARPHRTNKQASSLGWLTSSSDMVSLYISRAEIKSASSALSMMVAFLHEHTSAHMQNHLSQPNQHRGYDLAGLRGQGLEHSDKNPFSGGYQMKVLIMMR